MNVHELSTGSDAQREFSRLKKQDCASELVVNRLLLGCPLRPTTRKQPRYSEGEE